MVKLIGPLILTFILAGCAALEDITARKEDNPYYREQKARARIMELYRDCLERKRVDPNVDCSEFRTTTEIRETPKVVR